MKKLFFLLIALGVLWYALGKPSTAAEVKTLLDGWNVSVSHNGEQIAMPSQPQQTRLYNSPPDYFGAAKVAVCCFGPLALLALVVVVIAVGNKVRL